MAVVAVLLCVLLLSLSLAALLRRGDGRGPRWGALHLLHPQGALHLSRLARRHGPVLRLRLGGRGEWRGAPKRTSPEPSLGGQGAHRLPSPWSLDTLQTPNPALSLCLRTSPNFRPLLKSPKPFPGP